MPKYKYPESRLKGILGNKPPVGGVGVPSVPVMIRLPKPVFDELSERAGLCGATRVEYIRNIISDYLILHRLEDK